MDNEIKWVVIGVISFIALLIGTVELSDARQDALIMELIKFGLNAQEARGAIRGG
jgi:hypothetical protein